MATPFHILLRTWATRPDELAIVRAMMDQAGRNHVLAHFEWSWGDERVVATYVDIRVAMRCAPEWCPDIASLTERLRQRLGCGHGHPSFYTGLLLFQPRDVVHEWMSFRGGPVRSWYVWMIEANRPREP